MARRPAKLEVYEYRFVCPYCKSDIVFHSLMERILMTRRTCPSCEREMLIDDGRATKIPREGAKKPPKRSRIHPPRAGK